MPPVLIIVPIWFIEDMASMWTLSLWGFIVVTEIREPVPSVVSPAVTSEDQNLRTCSALDSSRTSLDFYEE